MKKTTIDIQAFINEHPFTKYQWMILALCFITVAMDGFDTAIIGFIASDLVQEWGVEKSALGLSLIHISEPTRRRGISYAVFC